MHAEQVNINVREAVLEDAEALAHIIVTATQTTFRDLVPDACLSWLTENERASLHQRASLDGDTGKVFAAADEARSTQNWREGLSQGLDPGEILVVAEADGLVIGYAMGSPCADDPIYLSELAQLNVLPLYQRQGVGRVLLFEVASHLVAQNILSLRVGVLRINPNRALYERLGGQYLYDRELDWNGILLPECVYGWKNLQVLLGSE